MEPQPAKREGKNGFLAVTDVGLRKEGTPGG